MLKTKQLPKIMATLLAGAFLAINVLPGFQSGNDIKPLVAEAGSTPKYVFYFIGDGMGATQRTAAEYYLEQQTGDKSKKLNVNTLPVAGINTTYSADTLVTDSAAAGTALATGHKTNNDIISKTPAGKDLKTLIEEAESRGMETGLITTTRITHATPAVFASHNIFRDNEDQIAVDYLDSGVDFFAGGGYSYFAPKTGELKSKRSDEENVIEEFKKLNYKTFITEKATEDFKNYQPAEGDKVLALFDSTHMDYEIDRVQKKDQPSLADMTQKAIDTLATNKKGFFMMVEGGRIDHACHANDIPSTIEDTLAFDQAVGKALDFYKNHKNETLIVVVGDHETGGMALGFGADYFVKFNALKNVKASVEDTLQNQYAKTFNKDRAAFYKFIADNFGLTSLSTAEKAKVEKAMDIVDKGDKVTKIQYGGYDPVAIEVTHIISQRSNMYWTTYAHTGTAIPLSAIGVGAENFGGYKDNTEIAQTMAKLMKFDLTK